MRRATLLSTAGLLVTAVAATAAALGLGGGDADSQAAAGPGKLPAATATVTRQTLAETSTIDGTLGYGTAVPVDSKAVGTLTWLPAAGTTVRRGETLLRADEHPVVLLYGSLPAYRPLTAGTKGADVKQFEGNLAALGYTGFTVDEEYSDKTVAAVKRWQHALALPETGVVAPEQVIYAAGPLRVAARSVRVGAAATGTVLTTTGGTRVVTVAVPAADAGWAVPGGAVRVTLPGGKTVTGTVSAVGTQATGDQGTEQQGSGTGSGAGSGAGAGTGSDPGTATLPATIALADQGALGTLQGGPVSVTYTSQTRPHVLTVPVAALLALAEGGYGLELVSGGTSRTVAITPGLFADGRVEVSGPGITEGAKVGMPQ